MKKVARQSVPKSDFFARMARFNAEKFFAPSYPPKRFTRFPVPADWNDHAACLPLRKVIAEIKRFEKALRENPRKAMAGNLVHAWLSKKWSAPVYQPTHG
jgi:hypothetical protein